jgi:hypothetical protein
VGADEFFFMKPFYSRNRVPQFLKRVGPINFPWRGSALLSAASRTLARRQRVRITRDPRLRLCRAEFLAALRLDFQRGEHSAASRNQIDATTNGDE